MHYKFLAFIRFRRKKKFGSVYPGPHGSMMKSVTLGHFSPTLKKNKNKFEKPMPPMNFYSLSHCLDALTIQKTKKV